MMFEYGNGWSGWDLVGMGLVMLVIVGVVAWVFYLVVIDESRRRAHGQIAETKEILDQRLAKGEIEDDEYRRMRELLDEGNREPVAGRQS
jgi:putative membrane protein